MISIYVGCALLSLRMRREAARKARHNAQYKPRHAAA